VDGGSGDGDDDEGDVDGGSGGGEASFLVSVSWADAPEPFVLLPTLLLPLSLPASAPLLSA